MASHDSISSLFSPIFVGGMPRSGTTLLRAILDSHPAIACGPELRAIPALAQLSAQTRELNGAMLAAHYGLAPAQLDRIFADLIRSFLLPLAAKRGKPRIAEKTPANALHFEELAKLFPGSPFVQVIRDGRDAVASVLGMNWMDAKGKPLPITRDPRAAAAAWAAHVRRGRAARNVGAAYFELRYEAVITDPKTALQPLFEFLGEPWSDAVLAFHANERSRQGENESSALQVAKPLYAQSIGRWRKDLSNDAAAAVKTEAGDLLIELGYARDLNW